MNRGGMGLGLTISKMIVQQLGGDITASSIHGTGSKFMFTIPIQEYEDDDHIQKNYHNISESSSKSDGELDQFVN